MPPSDPNYFYLTDLLAVLVVQQRNLHHFVWSKRGDPTTATKRRAKPRRRTMSLNSAVGVPETMNSLIRGPGRAKNRRAPETKGAASTRPRT